MRFWGALALTLAGTCCAGAVGQTVMEAGPASTSFTDAIPAPVVLKAEPTAEVQMAPAVFLEIDGDVYPALGTRSPAYEVETGAFGLLATPVTPGTTLSPAAGLAVDTRFYTAGRAVYAAPGALLPPPNDANDLFHNQLQPTETRMGSGLAFQTYSKSAEADKSLLNRLKVLPSFGFYYDTGFNPKNDVRLIALGDAAAAGQTTFTGQKLGEIPISLLFDSQILDASRLGVGDQQLQFFLDANNHTVSDKLEFEHVYGRVWDKDRLSLSVGETYSLFSSGGIEPATIQQSGTLIGSSNFGSANPRQIRVQQSAKPRSLGWGLGIEDPYTADFAVPAGGTGLTRWPTAVGNVILVGENLTDRVQLSLLNRTLGFQESGGQEHFANCWGFSAFGRLRTYQSESAIGAFFGGVCGGNGVGNYIHGVQTAAAFNAGTLSALDGVGSYLGHQLQGKTIRGWEVSSNVAYGYANLETPGYLAASTNSQTHQSWANLIVSPSQNVAFGVEYQFGRRETLADGAGENNRFLFTIALTSKPAESVGRLVARDEVSGRSYDDVRAYDAAPPGANTAYLQGL